MQYKRNIQNRKIQSKRVLGLMKNTHWLADYTLAVRGLEEIFFQLCCCVSFWLWGEIGFGFIYYLLMYLEYNTVVVLC